MLPDVIFAYPSIHPSSDLRSVSETRLHRYWNLEGSIYQRWLNPLKNVTPHCSQNYTELYVPTKQRPTPLFWHTLCTNVACRQLAASLVLHPRKQSTWNILFQQKVCTNELHCPPSRPRTLYLIDLTITTTALQSKFNKRSIISYHDNFQCFIISGILPLRFCLTANIFAISLSARRFLRTLDCGISLLSLGAPDQKMEHTLKSTLIISLKPSFNVGSRYLEANPLKAIFGNIDLCSGFI